jgi:hypothetical protein
MMRLLPILPLLLMSLACSQFEKNPARYGGLAGNKVGVMVWTNPPTKRDFPNARLDIAKGVQDKLQQATVEAPELKGISFPVRAESIAHYQQTYPQIEVMPIERVAPKLGGVTRLIYIEVGDLRTRAGDVALNLYRGYITGTLKVIEVQDGVGRLAYEESNIIATFPQDAPDAGTPNLDDQRAYQGAIDEFTTQVSIRFFAHYKN